MPARVMRQNEAIKELFRRKIQEKVEREKEKMFRRIESLRLPYRNRYDQERPLLC